MKNGLPSERARRYRFVVALAPAVGAALFSAYLYKTTGDAAAWTVGQPGGRVPINPLLFVRDLAGICWRAGPVACATSRGYDLLNVGATLVPVALLLPISRRLGVAAGLFVALNTAMPLAGVGFNCMGRYTSIMFPIFLWLALQIRTRSFYLWIAVSLFCQWALAAAFFTWRPVY
jgi:hypothetical protein